MRIEDNVCHLEGDSMQSMTTNDERFYDKYEKFRTYFIPMKNMTWLKIATKRAHLGVRGNHSNWLKNWSMKKKTSVI